MPDPKNFFLSLKQDQILGDSDEINHKEWMAADSWTFTMQQSAETKTGQQTGAGTAATGSFSFTRVFDKASGAFFDRCSLGKHIQAATFEAQRTGSSGTAGGGNPLASENAATAATGDVSRVYFQLIFTDLIVTGRTVNWTGEGTGTELISFAFGKVKMSYLQVTTQGRVLGSAIPKEYDAKKNVVV